VGFTLGLMIASAMAILDWQGAGTLVGVVAVMGGVQIIDGMVITPRIVGRSVGLAPLEVILTMMAAGSLFGFLGVLLAVPLGAVAKILIQRGVRAYLSSGFYNKAPDAQLETTTSLLAHAVSTEPAITVAAPPASPLMPSSPAAKAVTATASPRVIVRER
jgi:hypothetical protein